MTFFEAHWSQRLGFVAFVGGILIFPSCAETLPTEPQASVDAPATAADSRSACVLAAYEGGEHYPTVLSRKCYVSVSAATHLAMLAALAKQQERDELTLKVYGFVCRCDDAGPPP